MSDESTAKLPPESSPINRRKFLTGLAVGAGLAPLASHLALPVSARRVPLCVPPSGPSSQRPVLTGADFTYIGHYDVRLNGGNTTYGQCLAHRYVNGDLRLLTLEWQGKLTEFSLAGRSLGSLITTRTNQWDLMPSGAIRDRNGLWWDEGRQRLWTTSAINYTGNFLRAQIFTHVLNANGTLTSRGPVGLEGINAKRVFGGAAAVPLWFQAAYGVGPYAVGWGGYTSLVAQGGAASMGPSMYVIPEPDFYPVNTDIPANAFRRAMDCSAASAHGNDWYSQSAPSTYDRGMRLTVPINYFDGGDNRPAGSASAPPPTVPPLPGAQWLSPAPGGVARFVWGDTYMNTGMWIDGPNKHGLVLLPSLLGGKTWYGGATLNCDRREFELHVFHPAHIGEGILGLRAPWNVRPTTMLQLNLPGMGVKWGLDGNMWPAGTVPGATYDPVSRQLFAMGRAITADATMARLFVFAVNA
jgi:hypothetical protein